MSIFVWTLKRDSVRGTRSAQQQYWNSYNAYTSCRKQRLLECCIMEHSLTATNTFSNNDASNTNIYTFGCNGCHEPQQIDYILSSHHSLRSRTFDSSATSSDHWGLTTTIKVNMGNHLGRDTSGNRSDGNVATTLVSTTQCVHS